MIKSEKKILALLNEGKILVCHAELPRCPIFIGNKFEEIDGGTRVARKLISKLLDDGAIKPCENDFGSTLLFEINRKDDQIEAQNP